MSMQSHTHNSLAIIQQKENVNQPTERYNSLLKDITNNMFIKSLPKNTDHVTSCNFPPTFPTFPSSRQNMSTIHAHLLVQNPHICSRLYFIQPSSTSTRGPTSSWWLYPCYTHVKQGVNRHFSAFIIMLSRVDTQFYPFCDSSPFGFRPHNDLQDSPLKISLSTSSVISWKAPLAS